MIFLISVLFIIVTSVFLLKKWAEEKNRYWGRKNINSLKPKLLFGNTYEATLGRKNFSELYEEVYKAFPLDEMVGFYEFMQPKLVLRSPELVEKVLKNDFSHFTDRFVEVDREKIPLTNNLFSMCGNQWRAFRYKLSPIFTSGKLKYMFSPMAECGKNLSSLLDSKVEKEVDLKEVMGLFAMDVIGSCAFGIDPGVIQNPKSDFREMGKKIFDLDVIQYIKFILITLFPNLKTKLKISVIKNETIKYFCDLITNAIEFRKKNGIERNDFIQLLMQLKAKGKVEVQFQDPVDEYLYFGTKQNETYECTITDDLLVGTAFGFLTAGFHTSASAMTYTLYELAKNPEVLEKARFEISEQVKIHGDINYDAIKCMVYLEKVLKESMRIHPPAPFMFRVCTKKYKFPNGLVVMPGAVIIIPILALHRDSTYFPNPLLFDPDRFDKNPQPGTYLPFGDGPRICIAMRFAMLEMKFAISKILLNYNIALSKRTKEPIKMAPRGFLNTPNGEVIFRVTKRK